MVLTPLTPPPSERHCLVAVGVLVARGAQNGGYLCNLFVPVSGRINIAIREYNAPIQ